MSRFVLVGDRYVARDHVVKFGIERVPFESTSMSIVLTSGEVITAVHSPDRLLDPIDVYSIERELLE